MLGLGYLVKLLTTWFSFCFYWVWSSGVDYLCLIPELTWPPPPTLDSFSELACQCLTTFWKV